jgi:hypothetical protein
MDRKIQLQIFQAQTQNVRALEKSWHQLKRTINSELANNQLLSAKNHSKLLALIFCAWSEANFHKLIHTPHGFELNEIDQIKAISSSNIVDGWKKCLEIGLSKISPTSKSSYKPNIKKNIENIIDRYVSTPRLVRNKIAHGQWAVALNRDNNALNPTLTKEIDDIDIVKLDIWFDAYKSLSNIIESMIESPTRTFHRDYWIETTQIQEKLLQKEKWSLSTKISQLQYKKSHPLSIKKPSS